MISNRIQALVGDWTIQWSRVAFTTYDRIVGGITGIRVPTVSTSDLQRILSGNEASDYVVVDVRSTAEQSISMIPGAITMRQYESEFASYVDRVLIAYCTIGGRSYLYARKMKRRGIVALNYRDGIVGWCRSGLLLEDLRGQPTPRVHPYWPIFGVPSQYERCYRIEQKEQL
ncbi:MAG: rhodanese-like domain-containing protein [Pirellulaceae bacterium]